MATAKVGVEFVSNDTEFRNAIKSLAAFVVTQLGGGSDEAGKRIRDGIGKGAKEGAEKVKQSEEEKARAVAASNKKVEQGEKELQNLRVKYEHDAGEKIINDIKEIQDKKAVIRSKQLVEVDAAAKKELAIQKNELDSELVLLKQVAMEKEKVLHAGAGAKAGIMGQHRDVTPTAGAKGGDDGGGMLSKLPGISVVGQAFSMVKAKAKEADDAADGFSIAIAKAGLTGDAAAKEVERAGKSAEKMADDFAMPKAAVQKLQSSIAAMGGMTGEQMDKLTELSIGASNALGMAPDMVAKLVAKGTDPENEASLAKVGIIFDKNATAAERFAILQAKLGPAVQATKDSTQDSFGSFDRLQNKVMDTAISLSSGIFDAIKPILDAALSLIKQLLPIVTSLLKPIAGIVDALLKPIIPVILSVVDPIVKIFGTLLPPITGIISKIAGIVGNLLSKVVGGVLKAVIPIVMTLANAVGKILTALEPVIDVVGQLIDAFLPLISNGGSLSIFEKILSALLPPITDIITMLAGLVVTLLQALMPAIIPIIDVLTAVIGILVGGLGDALGFIIGIVAQLAEILVKGLTIAIQWIIEAIKTAVTWFKTVWDVVKILAAALVEKMHPAIAMLSNAWATVWGAMKSVADWVAGQFIGLWNSLVKAFNWVVSAVASVAKWFSDLYTKVTAFIGKAVSGVVSVLGLGGAIDKVAGWVKGLVGAVSDAVHALTSLFSKADEANGRVFANPLTTALGKPGAAPAPATTEPASTEPATEPPKDKAAAAAAAKAAKDKAKADKKAAHDAAADKKKAFDAELKALQDHLDDLNFATEMDVEEGRKTELEAAITKAKDQEKFDQDSLALTKKYGYDEHKLNQALIKDAVAIRKAQYAELKDAAEEAHADDMQALEQRILDEGVADAEAKQMRLAAERTHLEAMRDLAIKFGLSANAINKQLAKMDLDAQRDRAGAEKAWADNERKHQDELRKESMEASRRWLELQADGIDKSLSLEDFRYQQEIEKAGRNAELLELAEIEHTRKMEDIYEKFYGEKIRKTMDFAEQMVQVTYGQKKDAEVAQKEELKAVDKNAQIEIQIAQRKMARGEKIEHSITDIKKDAEKAKADVRDKYERQQLENAGKHGARDLVMQKLGLDKALHQILISKGKEAAIWIATEFAKTSATETNVFARIGMVAEEAFANLKSAASDMVAGVAALIKWQASMGWWNLLLIPGEIAAMYGMYEGAKSLFGFADGGIAERPIFAPFNGGAATAGEAGPELIAPLSRLPGLLHAAGLGRNAIAEHAMGRKLDAVVEAVKAIPTTVIFDQFKQKLSSERAQFILNKRKW